MSARRTSSRPSQIEPQSLEGDTSTAVESVRKKRPTPSEARLFQAIVESAPIEFLVYDPDSSELIFLNQKALQGGNLVGLDISKAAIEEISSCESLVRTGKALRAPYDPPAVKLRFPAVSSHRGEQNCSIQADGRLMTVDGRQLILQTALPAGVTAERQEQDDLLAGIESDSAAAASAEDFMVRVLTRLCGRLGCPAGHAYALSGDMGSLTKDGVWHFQSDSGVHHFNAESGGPRMVGAGSRGQSATGTASDVSWELVVDSDGEPVAVVELFHDAAGNDRLSLVFAAKISAQIGRNLDRKRIEEQLAETQERFEAAVRGANIGLWDYNYRNGKFWLSERCSQILGVSSEALSANWQGFLDHFHPDDIERQRTAIRQHLSLQKPYEVEYRVRTNADDFVWVRARGDGVWDSAGVIQRSMGTVEDITARKEAELLRRSIMTVMSMDASTDVKICETLAHACRYLKMPIGLASRIDEDCYEILHAHGLPEDMLEGSLRLTDVICSDVFLADAVRSFANLDDSTLKSHPGRSFLSAASYIGSPFYVGGVRFGTICFISPTPRTAAFSESEVATVRLLASWIGEEFSRQTYIAGLVESDLRKTAHLASIGDAVLTLNAEGVVEEGNPAAAELFGLDLEALKGRHVGELVPSLQAVEGAERPAAISARSDIAIRKDGQRITVLLHISEVRLPERSVFAAILRDWTAVKQAEIAKQEFVSMVSHELRTPLTSIRGALGLLTAETTGSLTPAAINLVKIAQRNSERLARLVNDILDIGRLESDNFELRLEPVHLSAAVPEAVAANSAYADRYGVNFDYVIEPNLRPVLVDSDRLMQILANLLSNAAKFTRPETTVRIEVKRRGGFARVLVHDQGQGVPEALMPALFQKFAKGDNSDTREREGSGLGLSISRQLAQLMKGDVGLAKSTNDGSSFFVDLPFQAASALAVSPRRLSSAGLGREG